MMQPQFKSEDQKVPQRATGTSLHSKAEKIWNLRSKAMTTATSVLVLEGSHLCLGVRSPFTFHSACGPYLLGLVLTVRVALPHAVADPMPVSGVSCLSHLRILSS